ncbi:50S ribosomal protein L11 methyltransferase [Dictyoglomus thermophilum]|uniref:Ribosomal protein L11 methyltransferase n=1 Tax=Dictyoglomus thermophilum (strain ATCC 35947 / DSM 3960 / H-6-12) TaxID=309799 RepID=PRMA_DICT6|nr:50S ribosomal protein L11 methyltransferase [Dictyoglomus thermophilum]B5YDR3.1 RecName: Full=Ribosomal protein L11 methyltransferase; Short=L11 Mtase [Dictyoglomus thermophilum H-6-12]ACI18967.1 ribosomal protein L11 methyltransferase [Dictyoglomus thermophilum H-6-12]
MEYFELILKTKKDLEEPIIAILEILGSKGTAIEDNFFDNSVLWDYVDEEFAERDYVLIRSYFDKDTDMEEIINRLKARIKENFEGLGDVEDVEYRVVKEEDWANEWKKYAKPIYVGRILILPSWEKVDTTEDKILVIMDPGMAFGSGSHPTTIMCIEMLQKYLKEGMDVLDVGTGSGILSIVAKKLGAGKVKGIDIDKKAVEVAKENAKRNNVELEFQQANLTIGIEDKYDIVVANLIAEIILKLNSEVKRVLKESGVYITSGIIGEKLDMVLKSFEENNIKILEIREKEGWFTVVGKNED